MAHWSLIILLFSELVASATSGLTQADIDQCHSLFAYHTRPGAAPDVSQAGCTQACTDMVKDAKKYILCQPRTYTAGEHKSSDPAGVCGCTVVYQRSNATTNGCNTDQPNDAGVQTFLNKLRTIFGFKAFPPMYPVKCYVPHHSIEVNIG
ncbi:hypothetical protein BCR37DRAFT_388320 [Protomyces lactucae-debilis]|uniref:Uncharacterized protein n=1 Tax=Protomyces lactucae-debilis TaxID=2754530 RepID=A0A1Y2FAN9_PROLT|nr:uncharacterized protein BCR37DRAFT_388320 [Protomyces lactucae-debilis]ORY79935.1 hypothetical protein BCR37DRAFT_388320 [Protomyces lactucae-debilis]